MVRSFPFRFARPAQSEALGEDLGTIRAGATGATLDGQARRGDATSAHRIGGWHLRFASVPQDWGVAPNVRQTDGWHCSGTYPTCGNVSGFLADPVGDKRKGGTVLAAVLGVAPTIVRTDGWLLSGTPNWRVTPCWNPSELAGGTVLGFSADPVGDELAGGPILAVRSWHILAPG